MDPSKCGQSIWKLQLAQQMIRQVFRYVIWTKLLEYGFEQLSPALTVQTQLSSFQCWNKQDPVFCETQCRPHILPFRDGQCFVSSIDINPPVNNIFLAFFQDRLRILTPWNHTSSIKPSPSLSRAASQERLAFPLIFNGDEYPWARPRRRLPWHLRCFETGSYLCTWMETEIKDPVHIWRPILCARLRPSWVQPLWETLCRNPEMFVQPSNAKPGNWQRYNDRML